MKNLIRKCAHSQGWAKRLFTSFNVLSRSHFGLILYVGASTSTSLQPPARAATRFHLIRFVAVYTMLRKTTLLASNCPMGKQAPNWLHVLHYAYSFQISELTTYPLSRYIFQYNFMSIHHRLGISAQKSNLSFRTAVSVYSIQRHSTLITHHELFSS